MVGASLISWGWLQAPEPDKRVTPAPAGGKAGLSPATYGKPARPSIEVSAASISGRAFPAGKRTLQSQGRTAWPGEAEAVLRLGSIWQAMPIVNQRPSPGEFNFMVICTDLLLLMGREELRASSLCSGGG